MAERTAIFNLKVDTQGSDKKVAEAEKQLEKFRKSALEADKGTGNFQKRLQSINKVVEKNAFSLGEANRLIENYQTIAFQAGKESAIGKEAIAKAAQLTDQMSKLRSETTNLSNDGKNLQGAMQLSQGVLGGYQAFAGVTAMLGVENEQLMQTMVKLQAVQQVSMGIESARKSLEEGQAARLLLTNVRTKALAIGTGAYAGAQNLLNLAIGTGSIAMKAFRAALLATGVGAIIVGIGLLVQHFDTLVGWVSDAAEWFVSLGDKFKWLGGIIDFISAQFDQFIAILRYIGVLESEEAAAQRKRHEEKLNQLNEQISKLGELQKKFTEKADHAIAMAKAEGKETHDLEMRKLEGVKKALRARMLMEIKAVETRLALGEKVSEEELKAIREIRDEYVKTKNAIAVKEAEHQTKIRNEQEKSLEQQQKSREKAAEERRRKAEEEAKLQLELERTIQDLMIENIEDANLRKLAKLELEHRRERQQLIEKYGKETELLKELEIKQSNDLKAIRDEIKNSEKEKEKAELEAAREEELLRLENDLMLMEEDFQTKLEKERELEIARRNMLLENDELTEQERRKIRIDSDKKIAEINQQEVERQKATDAAIKASKESLVTAFSGVYSSLKGLVDENSKLGKAMALTEIAVNTAIGFSKGLVIAQSSAAGTGPGAAVAFPIFYAQQIAAVIGAASQAKKILGTAPGISSSGGGGITAPSSGGGGGSAIAPPDVNDRNENEGSLTSDSDFADNAPQKVFVTETDISRTQQRSKDIRVRSTY